MADRPDVTSRTPSVPAPTDPGGCCWSLRWLARPLRYACRRPYRAAAYFILVALLVTGTAAVGGVAWFAYHLRTARAELAAGHNAVALRHLQACRRLWSEHPEVMVLSARVARRSGAWDEAEALLEASARRHGETEAVALERLLLRVARGDLAAAGPAVVARIRQGGPDAALAREALVTGLVYRFRWLEAERELEDWLAAEPDSTTALLLRGKLEEQRLNRTGAAEFYRRLLERDPEHDEARLRLAGLLLNDRRGDEALPLLEVLRRRLPGHPEVAVQWARVLALVGRTAESRAALEACLREHPDYPAALAERGALALLDGDEAAAIEYLARALALEPGDLTVRRQYALALARGGRAEEAAREQAFADQLAADYERITELIGGPLQSRPLDPAVHHEIGLIALRSGQVREAIRWFESALQVDPGHGPTHRALATLYRDLDQPILAARHRALAQKAGAAPAPTPAP